MLAFDFIEQRGGLLGVVAIEPVLGGGVERVHVARDIGHVLLRLGPARASCGEAHGGGGGGKDGEPHRRAERSSKGHGAAL